MQELDAESRLRYMLSDNHYRVLSTTSNDFLFHYLYVYTYVIYLHTFIAYILHVQYIHICMYIYTNTFIPQTLGPTLNVVKTKLLNILGKCPTIGTLMRKVKMIVLNGAVLGVQLCLFFLVQDFTQADFKVGDN